MTFKSIAEFLDPKNGHRPTSAERKLIAAAQAGEPCILFDPEKPTRPQGPSDTTTIRARLLRLLILGGTKDCCLHESGFWLQGGWIEGELDLAFCTGKGHAVLHSCHFTDRPTLFQCTLPQLTLDYSAFPGLSAQDVRISGDFSIREVLVKGKVDLGGATISGQLDFTGAILDGGVDRYGSSNRALQAQGLAVLENLIFRNVSAVGTLDLQLAKVGGFLDFSSAILSGGRDSANFPLNAIDAQGAEVRQSLYMRFINASGTFDVSNAKVGGWIFCEGAVLKGGKYNNGSDIPSLNAQGLIVDESLLLRSVSATGTLDLSDASIGGNLDFRKSILFGGSDEDGTSLEAMSAQRARVSKSLILRDLLQVQGVVDLSGANLGELNAGNAEWLNLSNGLLLFGFTLDRILETELNALANFRQLVALGSQRKGSFYPQPLTHLALVLRQMGHAAEARKVLRERERLLAAHRFASDQKDYQRALNGGPMEKSDAGWIWLRMRGAQLWSALTGRVAGYGYAPQFALYWSLACITVAFLAYMGFWRLGAMVPADAVILTSSQWLAAYNASPDAPALVWAASSGPAISHYETFYSALYALDVFLPIVDLGQQSTWGQTTVTWAGWWARLFTWGLQAAGYVITTLGLAAATGIIQRNQPD